MLRWLSVSVSGREIRHITAISSVIAFYIRIRPFPTVTLEATMKSNRVLAVFCDGTGMDGVLADPSTYFLHILET